jgi:hypothetical protein
MSRFGCSKFFNISTSIAVAIFRIKMATAMFSETLQNYQHSTRLIPESQSCASNSNRENVRISKILVVNTTSMPGKRGLSQM